MANVPRNKLIGVLSTSLAPHVASELVHRTAEVMGLGQELSRHDAMRLLDRLIDQPGLVGVSASFAKSQVVLWSNYGRR